MLQAGLRVKVSRDDLQPLSQPPNWHQYTTTTVTVVLLVGPGRGEIQSIMEVLTAVAAGRGLSVQHR